jgi:hypothetical protein
MHVHVFETLAPKSLRPMLPLFSLLATVHLRAQADWPKLRQ